MMKKTILLIINTKPIHGVGVMNNYLLKSKFSEEFNIRVLPYIFSESQAELGKINIKKIKNLLTLYLKLLKRIFKDNIDIAYRPIAPVGLAFVRDSVYLLTLKAFGIPYVLHIHGRGIKNKYNESNFLIKKLYKVIFGDAAGVIILGERLKEDIDFLVDKEKIYVVPNGIPDAKCKEEIKGYDKYRITFLSNMKEEKGVFIVVKSIPKVIKEIGKNGVELKFIFAGGWPNHEIEKKFYKEINTLEVGKYVKYLGRVSENEKGDLLCNSNIFIFPTYLKHEAHPVVILEAMRAGLPVIATNIGAIPEIVDDGVTGFIIPPRDSDVLAEKIIYLIEHPDIARKMGEAGRKKFEKEYTLSAFEKNMINVFNQILEGYKNG